MNNRQVVVILFLTLKKTYELALMNFQIGLDTFNKHAMRAVAILSEELVSEKRIDMTRV